MDTARSPVTRWRLELALLTLCTAVLAVQLLLPGYIGMANNGDFGKVCSRFSLAPAGGWGDQFIFFAPDYQFAPANYWASDVVSAEIALAAGPAYAARAINGNTFNIRWLGALHALLFLLAFHALLRYLRRFRPVVQALVALAALGTLGSVAYVAYFNTFYADAAAILGMLLTLAFAVELAAQDAPRLPTLVAFTASALLLVTSKTQHGLFAILPALFVIAVSWRAKRLRIPACLAAAILIAGMIVDLTITPATYASQALYNLIFFKMTPRSATPLQDLRELGLPASDLQYRGTHAFMPNSPVNNPAWVADFLSHTSIGALARFYLRHPQRAQQFLSSDLHTEAWSIRCLNLSNFRRIDGHPPGALTERFGLWTNLRMQLFRLWPEHVIVWYAVFLAVAAGVAWKARGAARRTAWLCLGIAAMAIGEFALASLADACETYRHLLMFHLLTDVTICIALGWLLHRTVPALSSGPNPIPGSRYSEN